MKLRLLIAENIYIFDLVCFPQHNLPTFVLSTTLYEVRRTIMRNVFWTAAILAVAAPAVPSLAQSDEARSEQRQDVRAADRQYREDMRDADNPREVRQARREYARNLAQADRHARQANRGWRGYGNYDWDRREPGRDGYDAGRYYRSGSYYRARTLTADDRVYRGQNGRYYCRRPDGTTGLIIGAAAGGLLGNTIARGDSQVLATLVGVAAGGVAGRAIERGNVRCR
ncbi:glycine zipper 2TM domain-containing protein [Sphingomonas sp. AOB5]|uniref:glycine zipper 2TM domain-containing protein n=1 Tax=Sphingomonas sp. AOB5 TaxID=3034017 RepID=UPI003211CC49